MSLVFYNIQNKGDANEEYVILRATQTVNIHKYMVADRTFTKDGDLSNIHRHTFRFPSYTVAKDEFVVLFTKEGKPHVGEMDEGDKAHVFYWGSKAAIWNDNTVEKAELLEVKTVDSKQVGKTKLIPRK